MRLRLWTPCGPEVVAGMFAWIMTFEIEDNTFWDVDARGAYETKTKVITELPLEVDE